MAELENLILFKITKVISKLMSVIVLK